MSQDKPIQIFFSYAHEDEVLRDELAKHLSSLERQGVISAWYDRQIRPGSEWAEEIDKNLDTAQIILLLVSADFIDSEYCYGIEMKHALERHEAGEARVIPIILRDVDWQGLLFSKLQALPKDAYPITSWDNQDEAFANVARGIRRAILDFKEQTALVKSQASDTPKQTPDQEKLGDQATELTKDEGKPSLPIKNIPQKFWGAFIGTFTIIAVAILGYFWGIQPIIQAKHTQTVEAQLAYNLTETAKSIIAPMVTTAAPTITETLTVTPTLTIIEITTITETPTVTPTPTPTSTEDPGPPLNVILKSPKDGEEISPEMRVSGTYSNLNPGWTIHVIKLPISQAGRFFPEKNYFTVQNPSGNWEIDVVFGQGIELARKEEYNIKLFVAFNDTARTTLQNAVDTGLDELPEALIPFPETTTVTRGTYIETRIIFPYVNEEIVDINSIRTDGDDIQSLFSTNQNQRINQNEQTIVKLSSNGTRIAYVTRTTDNNADISAIYLKDLVSGDEPQLIETAPDTKTNFTSLAWSPDDRYIVYSVRNDSGWNLGLYDVQNTKNVQLTDNSFKGDPDPSWIDTSTILYADRITTTGTSGFMSIDIATKETNIFFDTEKNEYQGVISPDGESIAYQVRFDFNQEIYVADLENGTLPLLLVKNEAAQFPLWDLNGRTIYYLSLASDPRSIYAIEKDGSNRRSVFSDEKAVWNMDVGYLYIGE